MASFAFNIAKGRAVELYNRVDSNDPANSALILVPMSAIGTEAQGQDADTLAAVEALEQFAEQKEGGWERKTLTDAQLAAIAVDDTENRFPLSLPEVSWGEPEAGKDVKGFLLVYDSDTTAGTDANIVPLACYEKEVKGDGNPVTQEAGEVFRAS